MLFPHPWTGFLAYVRSSWKIAFVWADWGLAALWCARTRGLTTGFHRLPDLTETRWDLCPVNAPSLVVIVPAKDEEANIRPAMETLLAQDYPSLRIVAVDDRSTDATGAILDELAAAHPDRLTALHLTESAEGWMGKTFAMEQAMRQTRSTWILFTDADVWFSPSLLRRAVAFAEITGTDHLVVTPSAVVRKRAESLLLGFLSLVGVWAARPWRVADPRARHDAVGAGAFNMVRREAWEELGGFAPQRLAVLEDLTLGRRMRAAGMRQRLVFAPGLVLVHWATGLGGLVRGMTKNLFALSNFRVLLAALFGGSLALVFLAPVAGLFWRRTLVPSVVIMACVGVHYREIGEVTGIEARWGWLYPLGAVTFLWAQTRSVALTLWRGGVQWRDTFYSLRELRRWNNPYIWEWEAAKLRAEQRRIQRGLHPSRWLRLVNRVKAAGSSTAKPH